MVFQNMQKSTGLNEIAANERKEAVILTGCLLCFQLTCQCSHSQKGAISGFSSVMNESGPSPIEESVHPTSVQSPSMWGVSILRITERLVVLAKQNGDAVLLRTMNITNLYLKILSSFVGETTAKKLI